MWSKGSVINTQKVPIKWLPHDDIDCPVCTVKVQRGRPQKKQQLEVIQQQFLSNTIAGTIPSSQISSHAILYMSSQL